MFIQPPTDSVERSNNECRRRNKVPKRNSTAPSVPSVAGEVKTRRNPRHDDQKQPRPGLPKAHPREAALEKSRRKWLNQRRTKFVVQGRRGTSVLEAVLGNFEQPTLL